MTKIWVTFLFIFIYINCSAQYTCDNALYLIKVLEKNHVQPIGINTTLSNRIFERFFENMNRHQMVLLQEDIDALQKHEDQLHKQAVDGNCGFLTEFITIYEQRLQEIQPVIKDVFDSPIDLNSQDEITFTYDLNYSESKTALKKRWSRYIRYLVLRNLYSEYEVDSVEVDLTKVLNHQNEVVQKTRQEVNCILNELMEPERGLKDNVYYQYLNSIALSYDPHTSFFDQKDKDQFENSLSTEALSFGISFSKNRNNEFEISFLSPGGAAWKSNLLQEEYILKAITFDDDSKVDLTCIKTFELNNLLEATEENTAIFSVKTPNGKAIEVSLSKQIAKVDDNTVKSFVLKKEDQKYGYLSIPSFYTKWEGSGTNGVANDVAKELIKIKREGIEGLVLDLRGNGGGSVQEAVNFIGIFINYGPVSQAHEREQKIETLKDMNRGLIYSGPLIILVNKGSASASEIMAAALQDYNRAIIVGDTTYGKSTGQIVMPLDTTASAYSQAPCPRGYVKVTSLQLYRVTGQTHQNIGVIPDIAVPSPYGYMSGEKKEAYSLSNDTISKNKYYQKLSDLDIEYLKKKSMDRVKNSTYFTENQLSNKKIRNSHNGNLIFPLNIEGYWSTAQELDVLYAYSEAKKTEVFTVSNNAYDAVLLEMNPLIMDLNTQIIESLETDPLIEESFYILSDLNKKP